MASWEKLPSKKFRGVYYDSDGKKQHVKGTFRLQSEALTAAKDAEAKARRMASLDAGTLPATITWGEWWDTLSATRVFQSDTSTVEQNMVKNHIRPRWGETPLNQIKRHQIQAWVNEYKAKKSPKGTTYEPSYVIRIFNVFSASVNAAVKCDPQVLLASPVVNIELPSIRKKQKPYMAMEDAPTLEEVLRDDYADAVAFLMETGLRPGELAGLHDEQVDVTLGGLWVTTVYVRRAKRMRAWPKDEDTRFVPLTDRASGIYLRHIEGRDMRKPCGVEHYDGRCPGSIVFLTESDKLINPDHLRVALKRAATRAGLPYRSGYAARRGFATRLARGGIDLFELMEIMGWTDPALAREYVQQSVGARERLMAALGDPTARRLRVVGPAEPRGTSRGTTLETKAPASTRNGLEWKGG